MVGLKIKFKVMKLEWLLIRPRHNTKTIVQQDSVKALHDNRNPFEIKSSFPGRCQKTPRFADQGHTVTVVPLRSVTLESRQQSERKCIIIIIIIIIIIKKAVPKYQ